MLREFESTKGELRRAGTVNRTIKWPRWEKQKNKQLLIKYYTENWRLNNTIRTIKRGEMRCFGNKKVLPASLLSPFVLRLNHTNIICNGTYLVWSFWVLFHRSRYDNLDLYFVLEKPTKEMYSKLNVTYQSISISQNALFHI